MKKAKIKKPISKEPAKKHVPATGIEVNRRKEWRFELPLATKIEGKLPHGQKFKEETVLRNISSGGAYFCLDSGVIVGSKLNLIIELPREVTEGQKVKLQLGGITVRLEEPNLKSKRQGVAVRFEKEYKFVSGQERGKK
jgi:c-di-GMP-binding flagellar brake protein YcgR